MDPILAASFVSLAGLAVCGALAVLARGDVLDTRRLERVGLLLHHGVALGVAVAAPLCALLGGGDGRPLFLCAAGPLLVLCLQDAVSPRAALLSVPLVAIGLLAQGLALTGLVPPAIIGGAAAGLGAAVCVVAAMVCRARAATTDVPRQRALLMSHALALSVAAFGGAVGALPWAPPGVWATALGAAGALGTAARLDPAAPPGIVDVLGALALLALSLSLSLVLGLRPEEAVAGGLWVALGAAGVTALVRASTSGVRRRGLPRVMARASQNVVPMPAALAAMTPLLDDAALHRPVRPRVVARVPARRVLEAALERARAAQPITAGPRSRELLRVDVVVSDNDVDLDAEPSELSEALCSILDRALRLRGDQPDTKVQVQLRGGPSMVTFEISDVARTPDATGLSFGDPSTSFMSTAPVDPERPDAPVALARARLLVERNGGKLVTRDDADGSYVQVTMPRRIQKGAFGQA